MSLARERLLALRAAILQLPRRLPQLVARTLHPNPALISWCKGVSAAGHRPVVLCRIERLGDIVASTPVAGYLKHILGPDIRIAWVCAAEYIDLLKDNPDIDAVFAEPCLTTWMMVRRRLPPHTLVVELFLDSDRCCWTGLRVKQHRSGWTIHNYLYDGNSLLTAYSGASGHPVPDFPPQLPQFARRRSLRPALDDSRRPRVAVHFSSNDPARCWPAERALEFCAAAQAIGCDLVELGNERLMAQQPSIVTCLTTGSGVLAHLVALAEADYFVGVESGFAHCANAMKIPSVILVGPFRDFPSYFTFSGPHARGPLWRCLRSKGPLTTLAPLDVCAALRTLLYDTRPAQSNVGQDSGPNNGTLPQ